MTDTHLAFFASRRALGSAGRPPLPTDPDPGLPGREDDRRDIREIPDELPEQERDLPPQEIPVNPI